MSDFSSFYANGGVFMHVITLGATVALTALLLHARARRIGDDDPRRLRLADRVAGLCVAMGLLGAGFGLIDFGAALSTITDPELHRQAAGRGLAIVLIPLDWALMCAIPIWIATTVHRYRSPKIIARREAGPAS